MQNLHQTCLRTCTPPTNGGKACESDMPTTETCYLNVCPTNGYYTAWSTCEWEKYPKDKVKCGHGVRRRHCIPPTNGGRGCEGEAITTCNEDTCPTYGAGPGYTCFYGYANISPLNLVYTASYSVTENTCMENSKQLGHPGYYYSSWNCRYVTYASNITKYMKQDSVWMHTTGDVTCLKKSTMQAMSNGLQSGIHGYCYPYKEFYGHFKTNVERCRELVRDTPECQKTSFSMGTGSRDGRCLCDTASNCHMIITAEREFQRYSYVA